MPQFTEWEKNSKREISQLVMTVFDPIGFLSPPISTDRLNMQLCWSEKMHWDETVSDDIHRKWKEWIENLRKINSFKIPRQYFSFRSEEVQLHIFCDAGSKAFCSVAYVRSKLNDRIEVSRVSSKCKLGPLNKIVSIPMMELQGAVMATRLGKLIEKGSTLNINDIYWWTDSEIVLTWIRSETNRLKSFHRIQEIVNSTGIKKWRWVPSSMNPAD
ncbi:hypothetical protein JTB14_019349 [Gonioctena quinquepunctata]|nr:hypothetical protein JTB14_019349 [Gonioctena quinquepunctata]